MTTKTVLSDYISLETLLTTKLQQEIRLLVEVVTKKHERLLSEGKFDEAAVNAESFSLSSVLPKVEQYVRAMSRASIEWGCRMAAAGDSILSSLALDRITMTSTQQLLTYIQYGMVLQIQKSLLQSIAAARKDAAAKVEDSVQKADAVRPLVSFVDESNALAQMISGLHTSRLGGWGFLAEAQLRGQTTYKLSAQLDNRTSKICRFLHGKTFTVDSALKVLDRAVYEDDPNSLKMIQPWPKQDIASMDSYESLTQEEMQSKGLHVPPFHPFPVSEDTEFLTLKGWKLVKDAGTTDIALSLNPRTESVEYVRVVGTIKQTPNPSRMVYFRSDDTDLLVSENHVQPYRVSSVGYSPIHLASAEVLVSQKQVLLPKSSVWVGEPFGASVDILKFLALWVASGTVIETDNATTLAIEGYGLDLAEELLHRIVGSLSGAKFEATGLAVRESLRSLGLEKKCIPESVLRATPPLISIFLETYLLGTGKSQFQQPRILETDSSLIADQLCVLVLKAGGSPTYLQPDDPGYRILWSPSQNQLFTGASMGFEEYSGEAHCLTLESNYVFLSRRKGKVSWTGNCRTLMVRVDHKSNLTRPSIPEAHKVLPDHLSTKETFDILGIPLTPSKLRVWNDYMGVDPTILLSAVSNVPVESLIGNAKGMIKVSAANDILLTWGADSAYKVLFKTGTGALELNPALVGTMLKTGEWGRLKRLYQNFGAKTALAYVSASEAYALSSAGFIPDLGGWPAVQATFKAALDGLPQGILTEAQLVGVQSVLTSTNPRSISILHSLDLPPRVLRDLFSRVSYNGFFSFDQTGLL